VGSGNDATMCHAMRLRVMHLQFYIHSVVFLGSCLERSLGSVYNDGVLVHHGHEGSHAFCESIRCCGIPADCSERFDAYQQEAAGEVRRIDFPQLNNLSGVALLRMLPVDAAYVSGFKHYILLVRTDLMMHSLSLYFKHNPSVLQQFQQSSDTSSDPKLLADPQFRVHDGPPAKVHFQVNLLDAEVARLVKWWNITLTLASTLRRMARPFAIATYEQFCEGGMEYVAQVLSAAGILPTKASTDSSASGTCNQTCSTTVQKVHGDFVRDIATNYNEILRNFLSTRAYPSWASHLLPHKALHSYVV